VTTALFERERTGKGRLVEVAMQEAAYATLTSHIDAYRQLGSVPPRTGNRSHTRSPLNVYRTNDGYVAINVAVEEHWHHLLAAMGREDLRDEGAQKSWRRNDGHNQLPKPIPGVRLTDRIEVIGNSAAPQAQAAARSFVPAPKFEDSSEARSALSLL
jgi:crotonobetainyl-CoA:carnitine CoA-transferase CaiB-like acyl-CoA transferase